jgi:hypothetical protein
MGNRLKREMEWGWVTCSLLLPATVVRGVWGYFAVCPPSLLPYLHPVSGTSSSQKVAVGVEEKQIKEEAVIAKSTK